MAENIPRISLTLWDSKKEPTECAGLIYSWNGYAEKGSTYSLFRYVEAHGERLRSKYLAWVHDVGEYWIHGKRIIDYLALDDGLSFWWMTLLSEKNPWKSPTINDAVRLFALEEIVEEQKPDLFYLVSSNRGLHEILKGLCKKRGISYKWRCLPDQSSRQLNLRGIYSFLPHPVQALIGLVRHILIRWPLRKAEKVGWFDSKKPLFLCSYFFNIDPDLAEKGHFNTRFWGNLSDLLRKLGFSDTWLEHYYPHKFVSTPQIAIDWVRNFNRKRNEQGFHTFIDTFLSWQIILSVLKRWIKLGRIFWFLDVKHAFRPQGSTFSLWPLMKEDWQSSMNGRTAIDSLLFLELFDKALSDLPYQSKGLYLCENMAWERALIYAWRKHGHGQLIAVAHSTIRFWDLRTFFDLRTIKSSEPYPIPQADLVALNGELAIDSYLSVGYPRETIVECEALRYGYLNDFQPRSFSAKGKKIKVLLLGCYEPLNTIEMLELLEAAIPHISTPITFTAKAHPNYQIKPSQFPSLNLAVVMDPLQTLMYNFDVACCSNMTSGVVDVYCAGLPTVVTLDSMALNSSPLRGQSGVSFVSAPEELAEALQRAHQNIFDRSDSNGFFFLDPELPRWRELLSPTD